MYRIKKFIRGNKYTKIIYYQLFKLKSMKKRRSLQKEHINVTKDIFRVFEENNFNYAYDFGSLLGIIREKKFMEHDDDIDLMIILDDNSKIKSIPEILKPYGFRLNNLYKVEDEIVEYNFEYKESGLTIDVFLNIRDTEDKLVSYWLYQDANKKYEDEDEMTVSLSKKCNITEFKYVNYWGVDLRIPKNAEEVLYWHYGEKWMVKNSKYSSKKSPGFEETQKVGRRIKFK